MNIVDQSEILNIASNVLKWHDLNIDLLAGEGSDRLFYRIRSLDKSVILMIYGCEKAENDYFTHIQKFLLDIGVSVPKILFKVSGKRWIFLEDLGDVSLYSLFDKMGYQQRIEIYKAIIDEASKIFFKGYEKYTKNPIITNDGFSHKLYKWEHDYFIENYLLNFKKVSEPIDILESQLNNLACILHEESEKRNRLIHRDLQSKNIMIKENRVYFIDFQGLRPGLPEYDLASLLHDPYIGLSEEDINVLLDYFYVSYLNNEYSINEFKYIFNLCSIQRLLQAIGAYCFLGFSKNKRQFLAYIPSAENKLINLINKTTLITGLEKFVNHQANVVI